MEKAKLEVGQLMQLNPETVENKAFAGCIFVVTEPKNFGAQGYVQDLGTARKSRWAGLLPRLLGRDGADRRLRYMDGEPWPKSN